MAGDHAGDMIGESALTIEMRAGAVDIGKAIHPHPTLGESIGMAAEVAHVSRTDLPPKKSNPVGAGNSSPTIGVEAEPPGITPARGPPLSLWDECDARIGDGVHVAPDWDEAAQPAPDEEVDQRVSW